MSFIPEEKANSIPKIADGGTTVKGFDVGKRKNPKPKNTSSIIGIYSLWTKRGEYILLITVMMLKRS